MKKIYSLIAFTLAAMSASAQVVLTFGGKTVDPSQPLEVLATETNYGDETDPIIMVECGKTDPCVKNTGSKAATFSITVTTDEWKDFTWCGPETLTNLCQPMSSSTETRSGTLPAGKEVKLVLDAEFGGFDEDYNMVWGPDYYATLPVVITITEGSKNTDYHVNFVYDQRSSCGVYPDGYEGIDTVLSTLTDAPRYDLQGRRTDSTAAGLFIQGGRKFLQK